MNEVINKYGVIWVASAGNHGPALCTIGTPPDISSNNIIGTVDVIAKLCKICIECHENN